MNFYPNQRLSSTLRRFREKHSECYDLAEKFTVDLLAQGVSELRIASYLQYLLKIVDFVGKRPDEFTKDDVRRTIAHYQNLVNSGKYRQSTIFEIKKTLKRFFKWLGKDALVNWFSVGEIKSQLSPQDLITEEEFRKMLDACYNSRDRALLSLLYETGARIGEIGSMRVKDVSFDEYGAVIWLPKSKTQTRKLRVVFSVQYLAAWLKDHPLRDDPGAPLWVKLSGRRYLQAMEYKDIQWHLKKIAKRAGLKKRIYPHLFRHTRATRLLAKLPESIGTKYMGWVPGSRMVKVYIHLSDEDVENAILEMHGITPVERDVDLEVIRCPRCTFINDAKARYCSRCGLPLTEDAVKEVEEWEREERKIIELLSKPEILQLIMKMQAEIERLKKLVEERGEGLA